MTDSTTRTAVLGGIVGGVAVVTVFYAAVIAALRSGEPKPELEPTDE